LALNGHSPGFITCLGSEVRQMTAVWKQLNGILDNPEKLSCESWGLIGIALIAICLWSLRSKPYV
jgi:hypothetical protein